MAPKPCRKGSVPAGAALGRAQDLESGIFCFLLLSAASQSSAVQQSSSHQVTNTALPAGTEPFFHFFFFYPKCTLQTSSFNSPSESGRLFTPSLCPGGTNLPPWECAQWKETGRDCNVSIKAENLCQAGTWENSLL